MTNTAELSSRLSNLRTTTAILQSHKERLTSQISSCTEQVQNTELAIGKNDEAHALISKSIQLMYESLSSRLGDIITEGLVCVFPDSPYTKFVVDFVPRRDSIEADLYLIDKDGEKYDPLDAVGGGVADLIALMLRITYIKLSKNRNFLCADEPLRFLDRSRIEDASKFIKQVCKDLGFQLLLVTHIPELVHVADKIYKVSRKNGVSSVMEVTKKAE